MAQRFLPLALVLIAFAGTLTISSWRAVGSRSERVSPIDGTRTRFLDGPVGVTAAAASASSRGGASLRVTAVAAAASNTTTHEEVSSAIVDSAGRPAVVLETNDLGLTERENPAAPHSARTR